jgi:type IV pilus assembly protein PilC
MDYVCRVGTATGDVVEQVFAAPDESALRVELEQRGYYVFSVRRSLGVGRIGLRGRRVRPALLLVFAQELATLLRAGLPLLASLEVMLERQRDPVFRRSLGAVRDKVKSGVALSQAFEAEGQLYPPVFAASLIAGERSGSLETVLRRFVHDLRLNLGLRKRAISASVYPAVLLVVMLGLVAILLVRVIPQFESFYEGLNVELPLPTRILMGLALWTRDHLVWLVLGTTATLIAGVTWLRREGSGLVLDRLLLRLPYLGGLLRMYSTSQLARTLATLLSGGLPLLNALAVAAASVGNRAMAAAVASATVQIREGRSLTTALEATGLLDHVAIEMVKVGEQTGALSEMLASIADFFDEDLETHVQGLLALIEPVMLVLMAVVVAGMLLAFYLPLFEAVSAVQRGM